MGIEGMLESIRRETAENQVWHENRVHHLLNKERNSYDNILVHTTKLYNIYRVNISAQFWILNELLNSVDLVVAEKGYAFDPITIPSSFRNDMAPFDSETTDGAKKSGVVETYSFSKYCLDSMISAANYKGLTKREKSLLISKHAHIKTFTGTPFDMHKSRNFCDHRAQILLARVTG
jgi:hypothetical protein